MNEKIETLETLIRLQELIRLTNKLKAWKLKDLDNALYISGYQDKLRHKIIIHNMVLQRLEQRFNKLKSTL